jgi:allograft inflammatory factor 1
LAGQRQGNPDVTEEQTENILKKFMLYDLDGDQVINLEELKLMLEKLGQPKTHIELKKMIAEVDTTGKGVINFRDFLEMMLGKSSNSVLKKILMFEELAKEKEKPKGLPPKKTIADLP